MSQSFKRLLMAVAKSSPSLAVSGSCLLNFLIFVFPHSYLFFLTLPGFFAAANLGLQGVHGDPLVWQVYAVNLVVYFLLFLPIVRMMKPKPSR